MELRHYLDIIVRWLWLIILSTLVAATSTYLATRSQPLVYRTKTTLMIGRSIESAAPNAGEIYMGEQLALTYAQLARREPVLKGAVESLKLDMDWEALAGRVTVSLIPQTQLMEISVVDSNPYRAKALADAIAQQLIRLTPEGRSAQSEEQDFAGEQVADLKAKISQAKEEIEELTKERDAAISARRIQDLQGQISTLESKVSGWQNTYSQLLIFLEGGNVNVISVVEEATVPTMPISSSVMSNVMLAAAIGTALAIGGAFLIEYLDDSIKGQEEVEQKLGLPTLGSVARVTNHDAAPALIAKTDPRSRFAEAYRMLRANLRYSLPSSVQGRTFLVTSVGPNEGKTTIATNLAVVMAQGGQKVILVDSDLRHPMLHEVWSHPNEMGLTSLLVGDAESLDSALRPTEVEGLRVLPSGPLSLNAPELLSSPRMAELFEELSQQADVIIVDTAPLLAAADASILAGLVTGTILVVRIGYTRMGACVQAVDSIRKVGGNVLGVVVNGQRAQHGGYYYYYHYDSGDSGGKKKKGLLRRRRNGHER